MIAGDSATLLSSGFGRAYTEAPVVLFANQAPAADSFSKGVIDNSCTVASSCNARARRSQLMPNSWAEARSV